MKKNILIISTGGTFNKIYNPKSGELQIDPQSQALTHITQAWLCEIDTINIIGKDSLKMTQEDRALLAKTVIESDYQDIIIIHGTDTIDKSAAYLAEKITNKNIVLTGAMVPYSIDPVEATANLALAYGYLKGIDKSGIYIAMNGLCGVHNTIHKNRSEGRFSYDYQP